MKRITKIGLVLVAGIIASVMTGCGFETQSDNSGNVAVNSTTPYASVAELTQLAETEGNVDWRISRFFALEGLQNFRQGNGWEGAVLSERPLVIHWAGAGEPRYYEFRVIRNGEEIGAIACVAQKQEGDAVQYVLPFATQVSADNARSVQADQGKFIDAGYPGTLLVRTAGNGRSVNAVTGIEDTEEYFTDVKVKDFLEQLDPAELEFYGITPEIFDEHIARQTAEEERVKMFWEKVYEARDDILNLTEEEILEAFKNDTDMAARATLVSVRDTLLPDWYNKRDWARPEVNKPWCGPSVISFITLGLGTRSGYDGVPQTDNRAQITAMYKKYESKIGTGAKVFLDLENGLKAYTNYKFGEALLPLVHSWTLADNHIRGAGLPAVSLRSGKTLLGEWHYRAIIGTGRDEYKQKYTFLWASWYDYYNVDWYYMWDNGADGGSFWEKSGQAYQLQICRVVRK